MTRSFAFLLLAAASGAWAGEPPGPPPPYLPPPSASAPPPVPPPPAPPGSPQDRYEQRYIGFEDMPIVSGSHGHVSTAIVTLAYQGKYRRLVQGADFYELVGRPDLAAAYRDGMKRKWFLGGVGVLTMAGGLVYALTAPDPDPGSARFHGQIDEQRTRVVAGSLILLGGGVLLLVSNALDPHPVDASEARRLAEEYNRRLWRDVTSGASPSGDRSGRIALRLGLAAGGGTAGLTVAF